MHAWVSSRRSDFPPQNTGLKRRNPTLELSVGFHRPGGVLLSHRATSAVPSALEGLTSEFGMGSGMAPPISPPEIVGFFAVLLSTPRVAGRRVEHASRSQSHLGQIVLDTNVAIGLLFPTLISSSNRTLEIGQASRPLVPVSSTCCHASTPGLSPRSLQGAFRDRSPGHLILRPASRLDAFSGYPFRT